MPILDKMTTLQLNKIKQELEDELRTIAPAVIAQLDLIKNILRSRESVAGPYSVCTTAADAVDLFFKKNGDFKHAKKEILQMILDGGYVGRNPRAARQQITDRLNYLLETESLTLKGDLVGHSSTKSRRS
jgi:hypothetical protein